MKKRIFKISVLLFISWFIIHTIVISIDGLRNPDCNGDVALVLGNTVNHDGSLSHRLQARLDCGLALYREHRVKRIIVSGGLGKEGWYEGTKMQQYLVGQGVPAADIITDNKGDNTLKSVKNTLALQASLHFSSVVIVSQFYHISRTKMLFRHYNFTAVCGASANYFEIRDAWALFREFWAYYLWWV